MANLKQVLAGLRIQIMAALAAKNVTGITVGTEWPGNDVVDTVAKGQNKIAIVHSNTHYADLNMDYDQCFDQAPLSIASDLSALSLPPGQFIDLTLSFIETFNNVTLSDAVSLQLVNGNFNNAAIAIATATDLQSLVASLVTNINNTFASQGVMATNNGFVLTITNNGTAGFYAQSHCGNFVTINTAIKWALRNVQIITWLNNVALRFSVQAALEPYLASLDDGYGYALESGELIRTKLMGDKPDDQDLDKGVYTNHYVLILEHEVTKQEYAYEILAGIATASPF